MAGFLAVMDSFLAGKRFILRGEEAHSHSGRPPLLNLRTKSDINPAECVAGSWYRQCTRQGVPGGCTYQGVHREHIQGCTSLPGWVYTGVY